MPFFGTLALFVEHRLDNTIPTAATDGRSVLFNPNFANSLAREELDAVMVHELLHAALLHCTRRKDRDPHRWNIAADIVVNGIIRTESALRLPPGACIDPRLEQHEVEEVYECLLNSKQDTCNRWLSDDLLEPLSKNASTPYEGLPADSSLDNSQKALEAHWRQALREASILATASGRGTIPENLRLRIDAVTRPTLDWRSILWRFLVQTPIDFTGFDRRFVGRGLYLESLDGQSVSARIAVDTSGSIDSGALGQFVAEIREVLRIYPHIDAELYFADANLHGPFPLDETHLHQPIGGGGTDFAPFFEQMQSLIDFSENAVLIYLTDGFGNFPQKMPDLPVLWVVPNGGLRSESFPFGTVARLISNEPAKSHPTPV